MHESVYRLATDAAMPRPGAIVADAYRVGDVVAEGGFAAIYAAERLVDGAVVALKLLDPILSRRPSFGERFAAEARILEQMAHPRIVGYFDHGVTDAGVFFLAMELLEGETLRDRIRARGPLSIACARAIAEQVLDALEFAHDRGVVHRDIKPENIFLVGGGAADDGEIDVRVLDFGIAKSLEEAGEGLRTETGHVVCSPHYVAPERVKGEATVPASDLYALGLVLIECLEGGRPYAAAETPMAVSLMHGMLDEPVPVASSTAVGPLGAAIVGAVEKRLDRRFADAASMRAALTMRRATSPIQGRAAAVAAGILLCGGLAVAVAAVSEPAAKNAAIVNLRVPAEVVDLGAPQPLEPVEPSPPRTPAAVAAARGAVAMSTGISSRFARRWAERPVDADGAAEARAERAPAPRAAPTSASRPSDSRPEVPGSAAAAGAGAERSLRPNAAPSLPSPESSAAGPSPLPTDSISQPPPSVGLSPSHAASAAEHPAAAAPRPTIGSALRPR